MTSLDRRSWIKQVSTISAALGLTHMNLNACAEQVSLNAVQEEEVVRLLFNENPYGPSQKVIKRIDEVKARSHRYATFYQYDYQKLKALIAAQEEVSVDQIALGHGSIQPLVWISIRYGGPGKEIIAPDPCFDVIGSFGKKIGSTVKPVLVDDQFRLDLPAMEKQINEKTSLVVIVNPNNPTGTALDPIVLREFCKRVSNKCPICIDEAYIHYTSKDWRQASMVDLLKTNPNLIITRTFSKIYGMAGLRMGFLMGNRDLIQSIESQFMLGFPGNMPNTIAVAAAMAALEDQNFLDSSRSKNLTMKKEIYATFDKLGWEYLESAANFVYFKTSNFSKFKEKMLKHKILLAGGWPSKQDWGRVTVGKESELAIFFNAISS